MADLGTMFGAAPGGTFLGLPATSTFGAAERADVVLIGAGSATPYPSVGAYCAAGPAAIRAGAAPYAANLSHVNFDLGRPILPEGRVAVDAGDLACDPADPAAARNAISAAIGAVVARGAVPVLLGGDDSVQIPMLGAMASLGRPVYIVQIDAHIDWRDSVQGERLGLSSTMRRASEMAHVGTIIQVGARGIGSARAVDLEDAHARGVRFFPAAAVARSGMAPVIEAVPEGADIVVCFDFDALDPAEMPAVIGRTAGGIGYGQWLELMQGIAARGRIAAVGMVEFMPERDIDGLGATVAAQAVAAAIGIAAGQGRGPLPHEA
jgi:agmatinase